MEITEVKPKVETEFGDLKAGDAFADVNGSLFLKITPTCDAVDADNAASFSGYGCMMSDDEKVMKLDARVLIFSK